MKGKSSRRDFLRRLFLSGTGAAIVISGAEAIVSGMEMLISGKDTNKVYAGERIYIDGVPFEKRYYDFPKFKLYHVEFLVAINPEKYQDIIAGWFKGRNKSGVEPIYGELKTYNKGNHIVVSYDKSSDPDVMKTLPDTMALAKLYQKRFNKEYHNNPDLILIDTTYFNAKNKLIFSNEVREIDFSNKKTLFMPAITFYMDGHRVYSFTQDKGFNIYEGKKAVIDYLFEEKLPKAVKLIPNRK